MIIVPFMFWNQCSCQLGRHYSDVIMSSMASQMASLMIVYFTFYAGADQRRHQSPASLAFVRGIQQWHVDSPHKGPVTRFALRFVGGRPLDSTVVQAPVKFRLFSNSRDRLTKTYDVTIPWYRKSHTKIKISKMPILWCMGSKFCVKFQRCPLKFHTKK